MVLNFGLGIYSRMLYLKHTMHFKLLIYGNVSRRVNIAFLTYQWIFPPLPQFWVNLVLWKIQLLTFFSWKKKIWFNIDIFWLSLLDLIRIYNKKVNNIVLSQHYSLLFFMQAEVHQEADSMNFERPLHYRRKGDNDQAKRWRLGCLWTRVLKVWRL